MSPDTIHIMETDHIPARLADKMKTKKKKIKYGKNFKT